mgnify:CR=1 FL=1
MLSLSPNIDMNAFLLQIWNAPLFKNGETYIPFHDTPYVYTRNWMRKILPDHFVEYLHQYARRQNAARFSISETALLCGLALTPISECCVVNFKIQFGSLCLVSKYILNRACRTVLEESCFSESAYELMSYDSQVKLQLL